MLVQGFPKIDAGQNRKDISLQQSDAYLKDYDGAIKKQRQDTARKTKHNYKTGNNLKHNVSDRHIRRKTNG